MDDVPVLLRTAAAQVLPGEPVHSAWLHGSRARGTAHERSDVDVAVLLAEGVAPDDRLALQLRLPRLLSASSGLADVDLLVLDGAPLALRGRVVQEGRCVFSVDDAARVAYESRTAREFFDYSIWVAPLEAAALRRHASGSR